MQNYIEVSTITFATASEAVRVGIEIASARGVHAVVTVVDPMMTPVAMGKADGATPHSLETSRRKAGTAASTRKRTGWMQGDFALTLPLGTGSALTNIRGGAPLQFDGVHVGALGIAGGTPQQDEEIATEVLKALGADPLDLITTT